MVGLQSSVGILMSNEQLVLLYKGVDGRFNLFPAYQITERENPSHSAATLDQQANDWKLIFARLFEMSVVRSAFLPPLDALNA